MIKSITLYWIAWTCVSIGAAFIIAAGFFGISKRDEPKK